MHFTKIIVPLALCLTLAACDSAEDKAEAHYERGLELLDGGDEARARVEFRNALKQSGSHIDARLTLARLNLDDRALRPAFRDYTRVAEQDPSNLEAQIALGQIAFIVQNWDAFERHSEEAIQLASDDPDVKVLEMARRYRKAVQDEDGPARTALLAEAEALSQTNIDSDILRQIMIDAYVFEQRYDEALVQIDKAIEANPKNPDYYSYKIRILANLQDNDGIEAELYRLTEVFPDDVTYGQNLLRFLISRGKTEKAEEFLRARIAEAPADEVENATVSLVQFMLAVRGRETALEELNQAIASSESAYTLRALRASLSFDAGAQETAITDMEAIIAEADAEGEESTAITPDQRRNIKVTLATMLNETGNKVGARGLVEQVLAEDETVVSALKMQARWMIDEDDTDGAINAMRTALATAAQDAEAMTIMAQAYQRAGNTDLMLNFLSLAVEASGNAPDESLRYAAALREGEKRLQAENILITSLRIQPNNVDILTALGALYVELEDTARARQVVENLRRIDTPQSTAAAAGVELELISLESGADEALSFLENLAKQSGGDVGVRLNLVRLQLESGNTDAALELIDELIAENPDNDSFAYFRAIALAAKQDFDGARTALTALVERAPSAVPAWLQLARLQSDSPQIMATIEKGLAANPGSQDLLWAKASYLQELNDIDGAIAVYEDLYATTSQSVVVANNLASLLATFRDDEDSLERAQVIARRLQGTDVPAFQDTYGWIQHRSGNSEEALTYLEPAAKGLPEDATVLYHLGVVYAALGRSDEALEQMRLAIQKVGPLGSAVLSDEIRQQIATLEATADQ